MLANRLWLSVILIVAAILLIYASPAPVTCARTDPGIPLTIEANRGQAGPAVRFVGRSGSRASFFTPSGLLLDCGIRVRFAGGRMGEPRGLVPLGSTSNYLTGNDPAKWVTGVPHFGRVLYKDVYPGIDLVYYAAGGALEYDLVVQPGADLRSVRLTFDGAHQVDITPGGEVVVSGSLGQLRQRLPHVYQQRAGLRTPVSGRQVRFNANTVGFEVDGYDPSAGLTVDPVLTWSTLLGGPPEGTANGEDGVTGVAVDDSGYVYVAGFTSSPKFPTVDPVQNSPGKVYLSVNDIFVTKLTPDASRLVYSTYIGGSYIDTPRAMAVDREGSVYVAGDTESDDFPTYAPFQFRNRGGFYPQCVPAPCGIADAFLFKLTPAGNQFAYSTYFGGSRAGYEEANAIAVDSQGNAYIAGTTSSDDFPITRGTAFQPEIGGGQDGFVSKFSASGLVLAYSTFLGTKGWDAIYGIAVDSQGNAYVTGYTDSPDLASSPQAFQKSSAGKSDAFVAKIDASGSSRVWLTYLGGSENDQGRALVLDSSGNVYAAGSTASDNFPVSSQAFQKTGNSRTSVFVSKLNTSGSALTYSTYLNGADLFTTTTPTAIKVDSTGRAYVTGDTNSTTFPVTPNAFQPASVRSSMFSSASFFSILRPAGDGLFYSTLLNASNFTSIRSLALDPAQNVYLAGNTSAKEFPTTAGVYQRKLNGGQAGKAPDGFIMRFAADTKGPSLGAIANAASYAVGGISPGEVVTAFGANFGPANVMSGVLNAAGVLDSTLGETRILFDDIPAPILNGLSGQVSGVVPYGVVGKTAVTAVVQYRGVRSNPLWLPVVSAAPAIVTADSSGKGPAAALHLDYSLNCASNPAEADSIVMFFCTGEGETNPAGADGTVIGSILPKPKQAVTARIGSRNAEVLYAGGAPGMVAGVMQVNLRIPAGTPSGPAAVTISVGGIASQQGVTVAVK